jgi:uncharacterized membrane protein
MTKNEKKYFLLSNLLITSVGIVYFIYKYFMVLETEYGVRPHSSTSFWLHFHIVTVPVLVLGVGYLLPIHILPKLKRGNSTRKVSGVFLISTFLVMVVSGYLLQLGLSSEFNRVTGWLHSIISGIWISIILWHIRLRF